MSENIEKRSNRQIIRGSLVGYLSIAVNIISGIVYTPWMIRQIGQSSYGLYTLAVSLINMLMMDFGIGSALSRFAARYRARDDEEGLRRFTGLVYKLYFAIDLFVLCVSVVIFAFLGTIYANLTVEELASFRIVYVIVVGYNLIAFPCTPLNGLLGAYEEFVVLKSSDLLTRVLTIIFVVAALYGGGGLYSLVAANVVSGLIAIFFKWWVVYRKLHLRVRWKGWDKKQLRELFGFSAWSTVGGIGSTLSTNLMPSIVAAVTGAAQTAIYGAATTLNGYAYYLVSAISGLFLPKVSRILTGGDAQATLTALGIRVGRILMMISSLILIGFYCVGEDFFVIWMGESYRPAYLCACFLLLGELAFNPFHIFSTAMTAEGYVKPVAVNNLLTSLLIILAGACLTGPFSGAGAAAAISIGYLTRGFIGVLLYKRYLGVEIKAFMQKVYGMALPYGLVMAICFLVLRRRSAHGWLALAGKGLIVTGVFVLVTAMFVLNADEKRMASDILKKMKQKGKR